MSDLPKKIRPGLLVVFAIAYCHTVGAGETTTVLRVTASVTADIRVQRVNVNRIALRASGSVVYWVECGERKFEVARGVANGLRDAHSSRVDPELDLESYGAVAAQGCRLNLFW